MADGCCAASTARAATAMNMLLPFQLTARPGRIDAAGEQVGILKSWMLAADRSDPQPVGYLWIEFERAGARDVRRSTPPFGHR